MMRKFLLIFLFLGKVHAAPLERTIVALYNSEKGVNTAIFHPLHTAFEMPLNHLGYKLELFDIEAGMPKLDFPYCAIITWFRNHTMQDPEGYLDWLKGQVLSDKKVLIINDIGTEDNVLKKDFSDQENEIFALLGLKALNAWVRFPSNIKFQFFDEKITTFEKPTSLYLPKFRIFQSLKNNQPLLKATAPGFMPSTIISMNDRGGYAAGGYFLYEDEKLSKRLWAVNPFAFFERFLGCAHLPKPDTTTHMGRRMAYSHVDGDGWLNTTELEKYKDQEVISADVLCDDVLKVFPDFPVTVGPIAGDLDSAYMGKPKAVKALQKMATLPHVEFGSHGYTHILDWRYYANPKAAELEAKQFRSKKISTNERYRGIDDQPRSYLLNQFSLEQEMKGSVQFIEKLIAPKKVQLFQWSGDALVFERALQICRTQNLPNINGGDSIFDEDHKSYTYVAPIGRRVGMDYQIYASVTNEIPFTKEWTDTFFGFQNVALTYQNTEKPLRVKPIGMYYHVYSCEKLASFNALLKILNAIKGQEIFPLHTSDFSRIAGSFYDVAFDVSPEGAYKVQNRGTLQTIRFDHGQSKAVDFEKSLGVLGQRYDKDVLYVALDAAVAEPLIMLKERNAGQPDLRPYLVQSRWNVYNFKQYNNTFEAETKGFGPLDMTWLLPYEGAAHITLYDKNTDAVIATSQQTIEKGQLSFTIAANGLNPVKLKVQFH